MPGKDYMAEYREKHKAYVEEQNKRNRARGKADRRLRAMYPAEWHKLYQEELKREGATDA